MRAGGSGARLCLAQQAERAGGRAGLVNNDLVGLVTDWINKFDLS